MARKSKTQKSDRFTVAPGAEATRGSTGPTGLNVIVSDPLGAAAESIHALRGRVQSQHIQAGRRALAICGPTPDVGCSFVAVNLAVSLAQIGVKTLLIDADLRLPSVHTYFDPPLAAMGLYECLLSPDEPILEFIHENVLPNLDVMTAGNLPPTAHELLSTDAFPDLIDTFVRDYDILILDTPPANSCADGLRISSVAGFSLIVARKQRTLVSDVKVLADQLSKEHVVTIGSVLNSY